MVNIPEKKYKAVSEVQITTHWADGSVKAGLKLYVSPLRLGAEVNYVLFVCATTPGLAWNMREGEEQMKRLDWLRGVDGENVKVPVGSSGKPASNDMALTVLNCWADLFPFLSVQAKHFPKKTKPSVTAKGRHADALVKVCKEGFGAASS